MVIRVTHYKGALISSYNFMPCLVDIHNNAFDSIWTKPDQNPKLVNTQYNCLSKSLIVKFQGNGASEPLEVSDLVSLANTLLAFQQTYAVREFSYDCLVRAIERGGGQVVLRGAPPTNLSTGTAEQNLNTTVHAAVQE